MCFSDRRPRPGRQEKEKIKHTNTIKFVDAHYTKLKVTISNGRDPVLVNHLAHMRIFFLDLKNLDPEHIGMALRCLVPVLVALICVAALYRRSQNLCAWSVKYARNQRMA